MKRAIVTCLALVAPAAVQAQAVREDYPPKALREHREGTTEVAISVDEKGWPRDCKVTSSSGSADLDEATCNTIYRRGHWFPALDEQGKPTASTVTQKMHWQLHR